MPTYVFEAMNSVGQPVKGEVDAATSEEAIAKVRAMGNFPTKIKESAAKKKARGGAAPEPQSRGDPRHPDAICRYSPSCNPPAPTRPQSYAPSKEVTGRCAACYRRGKTCPSASPPATACKRDSTRNSGKSAHPRE